MPGNLVFPTLHFLKHTVAQTVTVGLLGTGSLTWYGPATLTLTGNNTYSGGTTINGGTVMVGDAGSLSSTAPIVIKGGATLNYNSSLDQSLGGTLSGSGTFQKSGTDTLTLTGANNLTGLTKIEAGTVSLGSSGALGGGGYLRFQGGTLQYTGSNTADYSNRIIDSTEPISIDTNGQNITYATPLTNSNTGGLTKSGGGTLVVSGDNTYGGTTLVKSGTLKVVNATGRTGIHNTSSIAINAGATLESAGPADDALSYDNAIPLSIAGTLAFTSSTTTDISKKMITLTSGTISVPAVGNTLGTLGLWSSNTLLTATGTSFIKVLGSSSSGTNGIALNTKASGTASVLTLSTPYTSDSLSIYPDVVGVGALVKSGLGTLSLLGANSYSGMTTVNAGTLQVGNGGSTGTLGTGVVANNGILIYNRSDAQTWDKVISGAGALTKMGTGTLILNAANSYTGPTTVAEGILSLKFQRQTLKGGSITVKSGAKLSFDINDTLGDAATPVTTSVTVDGGTLTSNGTSFTKFKDLTFTENGGSMTTEGGDTPGWGAWGFFGGGTITANGNVIIKSSKPESGRITLNLENTVDVSSTFNVAAGKTLTIDTVMANQGNSTAKSPGSYIKAGSGTLELLQPSAHTGSVSINAGTLLVKNVLIPLGTGLGPKYIDVNSGATFILAHGNVWGNATDAGTSNSGRKLIIRNGGTLTNSGGVINNLPPTTLYGGGSIVSTGGQDGLWPSWNFLNGLTVLPDGAATVAKVSGANGALNTGIVTAIDVASGTSGTITVDSGCTLNINVPIKNANVNSSALLKSGTGMLVLNGVNSYTGITNINGGTLSIAGDGLLGNGSYGNSISNNGTLQYGSSADQVLTGTISGSGNLIKDGSGVLTLAVNNSYTGNTTVNVGTLKVGTGGTIGSVGVGGVINNGTLEINRSDTINLSAVVPSPAGILGSGGGVVRSGGITVDRPINLDGSVTIAVSTNNVLNVNNPITSGSALSINTQKAGMNINANVTAVGNVTISNVWSTDAGVPSGSVTITAGSVVKTTGVGNSVTITGNGVDGDNYQGSNPPGLDLFGSIQAVNGPISMTGKGSPYGDTGNFSTNIYGVKLENGSSVHTVAGSIYINGSAGGTWNSPAMYAENSRVYSTNGTITIEAWQYGGANYNQFYQAIGLGGPFYLGWDGVNAGTTGDIIMHLQSFERRTDLLVNPSNLNIKGSGALTIQSRNTGSFTGFLNLNGATFNNSTFTSVTLGDIYTNHVTVDAPIVSSGDVALISGGSSSYRSYVCSGVDSFGIPICSFKTFVEDAHVTASGKITVGGVLTVNAPGASTVSGVISGSGCLKMQGTGTLVLSKSNVYTGGTTVSAGTLVCAAPGCLGSSGIIKVVSGATLNLSGYYTKEALTAAGRLINNGTVNN